MDEVVTAAKSPNSAVRAHAFPALESGNMSFPEGRYVIGFEPGADSSSFTLRHRIEGAKLISDVIAQGLAQFVCTVASPVSSYRVSHVSKSSTQVIGWESSDLGEPPMFTPMVVVATPFTRTLNRDRDGVHDLWHGRTVSFTPGMRLALSDVVLMRASVLNMLIFERDPTLSTGQFRVEAEEREGFRFRVHLAPDLHRFLKYDSEGPRRGHILTHIVSACFGVLKADFFRGRGGGRRLAILSRSPGDDGYAEATRFAPLVGGRLLAGVGSNDTVSARRRRPARRQW